MPRPRTSMRKTKEILRLALKEGLSQRDIALSTGVGKTTVQEIVSRAKQIGLDWESVQHVHEPDIVTQLFPRPPGIKMKTDVDWAAIDREQRKKGNTCRCSGSITSRKTLMGWATAASASITGNGKSPLA